MMNKKYSEYLSIREDYAPCMTKKQIDETPETWLGYYPHETFVGILQKLLAQLDGGNRAMWITGAYGTGKSHAALVIQKLFMDENSRVKRWLKDNKESIPEPVSESLLKWRKENVLVVYESGSSALDATNQFLVRMQRSISRVLTEKGCIIPPKGKLDEIIKHVQELEKHFFEMRDEMQSSLAYLGPGIKNAKDLEQRFLGQEISGGLLSDVLKVLHAKDVYPRISTEELVQWVEATLKQNNMSRMIFIWDEFSDYVNRNSRELKTMEEVAEAAQSGRFFFIPVTHMNLNAYVADGSESAKKANGRFVFVNLDMPTNMALKLVGAKAFKINEQNKKEWERERDTLWSEVNFLVDNEIVPKCQEEEVGVRSQDFKDVLPLHPMTAFLLKHLSTAVGSNQRSLFDFLKGSANGQEFRDFINQGGPDVAGRQFLTVDHLWQYFIERDDEGTVKDVKNVRSEFERFKSKLQSADEQRVFKAVLLFSLLGRIMTDGHELLHPTIKNIENSFKGDGKLQGVQYVIKDLESMHCFSIVNDRCEMYSTTVADKEKLDEKKAKHRDKFSQLVLEDKTKPKLSEKINLWNYGKRYEVKVTGIKALTQSNILNNVKSLIEKGDGNKILLQFVLVKDRDEQLQVYEKVLAIAKQLAEFRIVFITMPDMTFCSQNTEQWETYIDHLANLEIATDSTTRSLHQRQIEQIDKEWVRRITQDEGQLQIYWVDNKGEVNNNLLEWRQLKEEMQRLTKRWFEGMTDDLSGYNTSAFKQPPAGLKQWALAGMVFDKMDKPGSCGTVINSYKNSGITGESDWFKNNPQHPLTRLRDYCKEKLGNTVGKGSPCSVRKIYIDLQRPPYGLLQVPYSAFVLGFVLKEWLQQNLKWTDGVTSKPLDQNSLAEIIQAVVMDDGKKEIKNEKLICRLSSEEKAFIQNCEMMFTMPPVQNETTEAALVAVQQRLETISNKVPLWMLSEWIYTREEPLKDDICQVIQFLCNAITISSKGNTENRTNYVKEIGHLLKQNAQLAREFAKYMTYDEFDCAFRRYVDEKKPELMNLANEVKDREPTYYKSIKEKCAKESGWLWNQQDIQAVLEDVMWQYRVINNMQHITGVSGFMPFQEAVQRLERAIREENRVSLEYLQKEIPVLCELFELIGSGDTDRKSQKLATFLENYLAEVKDVFFNIGHTRLIAVVKKNLDGIWPSNITVSEERKIYDELGQWALLPEKEFKSRAVSVIEEYTAKMLSHRVQEAWKKKTGTLSPKHWSEKHKIPAEFLFTREIGQEIIYVVNNPSSVISSKLDDVLRLLENEETEIASKEMWENRFLEKTLPRLYRKLEIDANELAQWLAQRIGNDANCWFDNPDDISIVIDEFVKDNYDTHYKKKIISKIKKMSDSDAKKMLLELVNQNPEVGLALIKED